MTPGFSDGVGSPAGASRPNPRLISNSLFSRYAREQNSDNIADMTAFWGQFLAHDILLTQKNSSETMFFSYPTCDRRFDAQCQTINMTIQRALCEIPIRDHRRILNFQTSYIDASMVYGATQERANALRTFQDGLLKTAPGNLMPWKDPNDNSPWTAMAGSGNLFLAGDVRGNENPALQSLHILFVREHNRKARELRLLNRNSWGDEELYQSARRWVISLIQKISIDEYLPAILGEPLPAYQGYDETVDPGIEVLFSTAAFRYGHSAISSGILRIDAAGKPIRQGHLLLRDVFFNTEPVEQLGIDAILRGLVSQVRWIDVGGSGSRCGVY
jgi:hypothetical protein